jgi:hypothetical protein
MARLIVNGRLTNGLLSARGSDGAKTTVGPASSVPRGTFTCKLDGTDYLFAAWGDGSKVTIWRTEDLVTWTDITPTTGAFGDTRLTDSATRAIYFSVVKDRPENDDTAYDLLLIQNGVDNPRVYGKARDPLSPFGHNTFGMAVLTQPDRVADDASLYLKAKFAQNFNLSSGVITDDDAAKMDMAVSLGTLLISTFAGYTVGTKSKVLFPVDKDFTNSRQFVIAARHPTNADYWTENVIIELIDSAAVALEIYNPSTGVGSAQAIAYEGDAQTSLIGYTLPPASGGFDYANVAGFRIALTAAPAGSETLTIYMAAGSGQVRGGTNFAVALHSSDSRAIGPGTVITREEPIRASDNGGGVLSGSMPLSPLIFYDYEVGLTNLSQAQLDAGINQLYFYANTPGTDGYYWIGEASLSVWSTLPVPDAWVLSGGTVDTATTAQLAGSLVPNLAFYAPDEIVVTLPTGKAMAMANGRLFVLQDGRLWFSEWEMPFRFRRTALSDDGVTVVPQSGSSIGLDGQTYQQIVSMGTFAGTAETAGAPISGAATLFVLTDRNLYALSGVDAMSLSRLRNVAAIGTLSPFSVARHEQGFYWLDDEGYVQKWTPAGIRNLSRGIVDDITRNVPAARRIWACGACRDGRYHLAYSAVGESENNYALVYSEFLQGWESRDSLPEPDDVTFITAFYHSNRIKLIGFTARTFFEYDRPIASGGTVAFQVITREIAADFMAKVYANGSAILADPVSGATLTVNRYFPCETLTPVAGTINLAQSTLRAWMHDQPGVGGEGGSFYLETNYALAPAGWTIYALAIDTDKVGNAGWGNR